MNRSLPPKGLSGWIPQIEPDLAADGIDELLTVLLPVKLKVGGTDLLGLGSLHVHCTDVAGEWLLNAKDSGVEVTRAHDRGDGALRGPAADLLLRLSNRGDGGEVIGDAAVVASFTERFKF